MRKLIRLAVLGIITLGLAGTLSMAGVFLYLSPRLPDIETLRHTEYQVPLRVYSDDGKLVAEFGEKRRTPLDYKQIPPLMIKAVLGAEDDRFFEHPGVDYQGVLRAVAKLVLTGEKVEGGSTITMQVARNFFLSREKTFLRKFSEVLLAFRIEDELSKEEILSLYLNQIYFGNRAYGVGAASYVYYGKPIDQISVAEMAMIAGLPKAPSRYNPVVNPKRAELRRNYVLRRMLELNYIDKLTYDNALLSTNVAKLHNLAIEVEAPYAAEMVRQEMVDRYGEEDVYTKGLKVTVTLKSNLQNKAVQSLRETLLDYESRHGYRGPEKRFKGLGELNFDEMEAEFAQMPDVPKLEKGAVVSVDENKAYVLLASGRLIQLCWPGMAWAAPYTDGDKMGAAPKLAAEILQSGDLIRVFSNENGEWQLSQVPEVEGALVSLDSHDGAILALVGGYDFEHSKFNRAAQAKRQPGSSLKPFIYSAALEKGYTAATIINDAPVVFDDPGLEDTWRPENYSGQFFGPTRFREALVNSRNLVSIRILQSISARYAVQYLTRFGFDKSQLPHDLSLALGSATLTPLEIASGYTTFSNGGYHLKPYLVKKIEAADGKVLFTANPPVACPECEKELAAAAAAAAATPSSSQTVTDAGLTSEEEGEDQSKFVDLVESNQGASGKVERNQEKVLAPRTVDERNVYVMTSIMRDIVKRGTAKRASSLKRGDLAGKTGTTNDGRDAWFAGFNSDIVTVSWVGFDEPHPLGEAESGASAALPMWISYMGEALKTMPEKPLVQPPGLVTVRIDPETGQLAGAGTPGAIFEIFREENAPKQIGRGGSTTRRDGSPAPGGGNSGGDAPELF